MIAADIMTTNIITVTSRTPLREAIRLMLDEKISGLPVVDAHGRIEGILTEGDLLHRSEIGTERRHWPWLDFLLGPGHMAADYVRTHGRLCGELMTRDVISISPHTPLAQIVELMERRHIKRVPVVEDEALVGIVTRADLLTALARALDRVEAAPVGDDDIRARVVAELDKLEWAPRSGLTITVQNGIVELDGVILDEHERIALRVAAENLPGVNGVVDRLVWVEPVSGTAIEGEAEGPGGTNPPPR
jgi:CBS domain-containing protein